mgnify:CR=1 FL=1
MQASTVLMVMSASAAVAGALGGSLCRASGLGERRFLDLNAVLYAISWIPIAIVVRGFVVQSLWIAGAVFGVTSTLLAVMMQAVLKDSVAEAGRPAMVMLRLSPGGDSARVLWRNREVINLSGGAILNDSSIYMSAYIQPRWYCLDRATGKTRYISRELGGGAVIYADGQEVVVPVVKEEKDDAGRGEGERRGGEQPVLVHGEVRINDRD